MGLPGSTRNPWLPSLLGSTVYLSLFASLYIFLSFITKFFPFDAVRTAALEALKQKGERAPSVQLMKCTLIVINGKERSQRSCEMTERPTTREQLLAFLTSQDLRLESGGFDYTVSLDGVDGDARPLKTDADVRLFLAQAKQLSGGRATFHIYLHQSGASLSGIERFLSADDGIDMDLVTLHIYPPTTSTSTAAPAAPSATAAASSPSSPSHPRPYQEKMFVVPTRFVLDGLLRAVKDTLSAEALRRGTKVLLYTLGSDGGTGGAALADDAAALSFLHSHAKKREPARLTYALQAVSAPLSRRTSLQPEQPLPPHQKEEEKAPVTPTASATPHADDATAAATPDTRSRHNVTLPPLEPVGAPTPTTKAPGAGASVVKPDRSTACAAKPTPLSLPPHEASDRRRSSSTVSSEASANTPYRAFLREPVSPSAVMAVQVEVRMEEATTTRSFLLSYLKSDVQLYRRFSAECTALFATAATASGGSPVLTLSSDPTVLIDSDGVLRELLALAKEAQQPLRVRLHFLSPSKPRHPRADGGSNISNSDGQPLAHDTSVDTEVQANVRHPASERAAQPIPTEPSPRPPSPSLPKGCKLGDGDASGPTSPHRSSSPRLPSLADDRTGSLQGVVAKEELRVPSSPSPSLSPMRDAAEASFAASGLSGQPTEGGGSTTTPVAAADSSFNCTRAPTSESREDEGGPTAVMSTTPGRSAAPPLSALELLHPCFYEVMVDGDDHDTESFYRFQAATRWGTVSRMTLCRVRRGQMYNDLRDGVSRCFTACVDADRSAVPLPSLALTMEFVYVKDDTAVSLPLFEETALDDVLRVLHVESAELRITSPPLPPAQVNLSNTSFVPIDTHASAGGDPKALQFIASATVRQLQSVSLPLTPKEARMLMCSLLGSKAVATPFKDFLEQLDTSVSDRRVPVAEDSEADDAAATALREWLQEALFHLNLSPAQTHTVLREVASSLLCGDLRDNGDDRLDLFFADLSAAVGRAQGKGDTAALHFLWKQAKDSASAHQADTANDVPATRTEWKAAFTHAPSMVLDVIAAAHMDNLVVLPSARRLGSTALLSDDDGLLHEAFHKAQLQLCEVMAPGELESYFTSADMDDAAAAAPQRCRAVLLSCMGALLAPASITEDYADWLVTHFCGRVGAVLYAKMASFDGRAELSLPALTVLSWSVLHPTLLTWVKASAHRGLLGRLLGWVRVAAEHACSVRHLLFPPTPLYGVHPSLPAPLHKHVFPASPAAGDTPSSPAVHEAKVDGSSAASALHPAVEGAATTGSPTVPLTPSPPPPLPSSPPHRATSSKRVQYVYKYNFNELHRPRSSAS
jgi:hypothetical protein